MARVLVCLDAQPQADGSCQQSAWIEQPSILEVLPTMEVADMWGKAFFGGIVLLAVAAALLKPSRSIE